MTTIHRENLSPETVYNMVFDDVFNPSIEVFSARAQGGPSRIMLFVHHDKLAGVDRFRVHAVGVEQITDRPGAVQFSATRLNAYDDVVPSRDRLLAYCQECFKKFRDFKFMSSQQSGAGAARRFDKPKVAGASPASATNPRKMERIR